MNWELLLRRISRLERAVDALGDGGADGTPGGWSLATPPATPHAYDDEFDGDSLDAAWTMGGSPDATAISPHAAFTTANTWRYSHNSLRPSWLMIQPASQLASINVLHKPITVPSDFLMWARIGANHRNAGPNNNDHSISFGFCQTSGGAPDTSNFVRLWLLETDGGTKHIKWDHMVGGVLVQTNVPIATNIIHTAQFGAIQRSGNTYSFWVADNSGSWFYLGRVTAAISPDRCYISVHNTTTTTPGNMIMGIDFIRFQDGVVLP